MVNARIWSRIQPPWDKAEVLDETPRAAAEELDPAAEDT
jgi:hypothetical protein